MGKIRRPHVRCSNTHTRRLQLPLCSPVYSHESRLLRMTRPAYCGQSASPCLERRGGPAQHFARAQQATISSARCTPGRSRHAVQGQWLARRTADAVSWLPCTLQLFADPEGRSPAAKGLPAGLIAGMHCCSQASTRTQHWHLGFVLTNGKDFSPLALNDLSSFSRGGKSVLCLNV